ncbi:mannose-1-phosphate guanylyltransferase/mannose-1-phosphate guanylyltransferase / mannose-6-phosphate isomerase, partial [Noviherbaspirillum humi]
SRLWPLSRALRPKQFLGVTEDTTLFQLTLDRLKPLGAEAPIVVANDDHRFLVAEQCRALNVMPQSILLEPVARNTAPAIAVAAFAAQAKGDDPLLLVLPADHLIANVDAFAAAVKLGMEAAAEGFLVTFGTTPTYAETGYGYVKAGALQRGFSGDVRAVERFVEKPDLPTAQRYLDDGGYTWNSGMFLFRASSYLQELREHHPAMFDACQQAWTDAKHDYDFTRIDKAAFGRSPSDSIDYAVMEKTRKAAVIALDAGWSDVGAWSAVSQAVPADEQGNAARGDVLLEGAKNCYVHADCRLVTLVGVDDLVVVETSDAVLVAHKDRAQDVKKVVERLKAQNRPETEQHREVFRPWGSYDSIGNGARYQVKRITVNPGAKLSVQMHHHRAEHWVVVKGTARVKIDDSEQLVTENQSVYISIGQVHSLENPGKLPLELIEVQSGAYLGEDDIVRFEDK